MKQKSKFSSPESSQSMWFLLTGSALVTIYFNTKALDPFNTPKLSILLIISSWLFGHVYTGLIKKNGRIINPVILILIGAFNIGLLASFIHSENKILSLIGETQRRNGLLNYISMTVLFIYLILYFNFVYAERLIRVIIMLNLLLSSYGLLQINGKDFVSWNNPYNSMISTLGNPNFASAILAVLSIVSLFSLRIGTISKLYKFIALISVFISMLDIFKSQSRQGLLVFGIGILVYLSILTLTYKKTIWLLTLFTSLSITVLSILGMLQKGPFQTFLYKDSVSVRGYYWRAGIEMFKNNPIFGVGLDAYGTNFKTYREPGYALKYGYEITSSNAHNTYIQMFATGGIFVGLAYIGLLLCVLILGLKLIKSTTGNQRNISLLLLTAWIGFQAQSLISIDNVAISIWGWVLGGAILGLYIQVKNKDADEKIKSKRTLLQPTISILIILPTLLITYSFYEFERDAYMVRSNSNQNSPSTNDYIDKVLNNPLSDPYYKFESALSLVNIGQLERAKIIIQELHAKDPKNLDYLRWLLSYQLEYKNYNKAISYYKQISLIDPWNVKNLLGLGLLYKELGDEANKNLILKQILQIAPNSEISLEAMKNL